MTIFDRVKILADRQGLSLKELALKVGFGENAIYKWKSSTPSADKLEVIADYFDISVDYLLGRDLDSEPEIQDRNFYALQRSAKKMTPEQREKAIKLLEVAFDDDDLWEDFSNKN